MSQPEQNNNDNNNNNNNNMMMTMMMTTTMMMMIIVLILKTISIAKFHKYYTRQHHQNWIPRRQRDVGDTNVCKLTHNKLTCEDHAWKFKNVLIYAKKERKREREREREREMGGGDETTP